MLPPDVAAAVVVAPARAVVDDEEALDAVELPQPGAATKRNVTMAAALKVCLMGEYCPTDLPLAGIASDLPRVQHSRIRGIRSQARASPQANRVFCMPYEGWGYRIPGRKPCSASLVGVSGLRTMNAPPERRSCVPRRVRAVL